jgi:membrane fusion protein, multidrug efflux system
MKKYIAFAILAVALAACSNNQSDEARQKKIDKLNNQIHKLEVKRKALLTAADTIAVARIYPVRVEEIKLSAVTRTIDFTANLKPFDEVYLAPASPGRIQSIKVDVGARVSKGQQLILMDQTQLNQAKLQLSQLEADYERLKTLRETNSVAAQQYEQMKTQLDVTRSSVQFLTENTFLAAPFSAIVTARYFENGELYSGAPNTQAGKAAILVLQQIDRMKVDISLTEQYFPSIKMGMSAQVASDVYPNETFEGKVSKVYPSIDPISRTFKAEVIITNKENMLRPGMFSRVQFNLGQAESIVVPAIAVLQQEGTNNRYIFVNRNGVAQKIDVTSLKRYDEMIEISSTDLQLGDQLIVTGQSVLSNNDKVKVSN